MKRRREAHDDGPDDKPESSSRRDVDAEGRSNASVNEDDPPLQSSHKIFLSHSGYQKDFVEELCVDLEKQYRFPFFDRRSSSLPKGERFPELIKTAARQCELAVVVLSENFLTSKWPMIELNIFVQTRLEQENSKSSTELKILPLFYGLSVADLGDEERRKGWFGRWVELAKEDPRIDVEAWKRSLKELDLFNGIPYSRESGAEKAYREEVVRHICRAIPRYVKWDESDVRGGSTICQVIQDQIKHIQLSKQYKVYIVGIYGVGGIGKTTACKVLCNDYFDMYKGKVSIVDMGLENSNGVVKKVLKDLIGATQDFYEQLDDEKCWNILHNDMCKERTFLAIDNVWPTSKSKEEAQKYLKLGFHKDSIVMVTSRALGTLTHLGISESSCLEMPSLGHEDATSLFLHYAAPGSQLREERAIQACLERCYFCKGNGESGQYLPLALKVLGLQLLGKKPSEWVRALPKERNFNSGEKEDPVFSILGSSFKNLQFIHKCLFMNVVLYAPNSKNMCPDVAFGPIMEWLSAVYNKDVEEIGVMLQHLQGKGLIEDVDMILQRVQIHDVYREFCKLEAQGKVNELGEFEKRRWVYYDGADDVTELEKKPPNRCWANLIGVCIVENSKIGNLGGIKWRYFSNVEVLRLCKLRNLQGELNVRGLKCLRSLEILDTNGLDTVDGLQDLTNLAYFSWVSNVDDDVSRRIKGQLPASLQVLTVYVYYRGVSFAPDLFTRCANLTTLKIISSRVKNLDFSACAALQSVVIHDCEDVENLDISGCSSLQNVNLKGLPKLQCLRECEQKRSPTTKWGFACPPTSQS